MENTDKYVTCWKLYTVTENRFGNIYDILLFKFYGEVFTNVKREHGSLKLFEFHHRYGNMTTYMCYLLLYYSTLII